MIHSDLPALALFTAGAIAVIQQIELEVRPPAEETQKDYSLWEEKLSRYLPFIY
ncbi:MAG: hypothetical protein KC897_08685 [Candidatus Omnitrophica bacterium]|nr:hypothetical protein [Candidatus Omnitrophota bacterium]MCB9720237.1 hypothetical protein [Candidatus Omnitrophota bacterium]